MQSASSRIWTRVAVSISYDDKHYTTGTSLPGSGHIDTAIWMHYMDANKTAGEEARRQLHKNAASNLEQVLAATPHKTPTVRPPASYHENYSS